MEAASGGTPATKAVLFDLDGTLFDHYHSVRSAISAIQAKYSSLTGYETEHLITKYNEALQEAYDKYLAKEISYDECDTLKVRLFFTTLGLPEPSPDEVKVYRDTYKPAYRENRRATPGSIEMLVRLREHGYRLAIVSNGQAEDQVAKAQSIGVHHLVDRILTSEEAGCCKPDRQIFQLAISTLGADPSTAVMVGDSVVTDVKGALDVGIRAVLYSPVTYERVRIVSSNPVPVIRHMSQLGEHLGIGNPRFNPCINSDLPGQLTVDAIGIDLVTEKRHCLRISSAAVQSLAQDIGRVLKGVAEKRYLYAMSRLEAMIRVIAEAATPIDETRLRISYPGQGRDEYMLAAQPECKIVVRDSSVRAEYAHLVLAADAENEAVLQDMVVALQSHCNNLMRDYPRAATRDLRQAMLLVAEKAGIKDHTIVEGEKIDE